MSEFETLRSSEHKISLVYNTNTDDCAVHVRGGGGGKLPGVKKLSPRNAAIGGGVWGCDGLHTQQYGRGCMHTLLCKAEGHRYELTTAIIHVNWRLNCHF